MEFRVLEIREPNIGYSSHENPLNRKNNAKLHESQVAGRIARPATKRKAMKPQWRAEIPGPMEIPYVDFIQHDNIHM
jgi:hypothetical protein